MYGDTVLQIFVDSILIVLINYKIQVSILWLYAMRNESELTELLKY